jgi:LmbE family N-acetylglucosaminyl deacetylase
MLRPRGLPFDVDARPARGVPDASVEKRASVPSTGAGYGNGAVPTKTKPPSAFPSTAPTAEREWAAWARGQTALSWPSTFAAAARVVVVSPHPDDETLGSGALIATLHARGHSVVVVAVTDGEGSHPDVADLAAIRLVEQSAALRALGVEAAPIRLGLPDAGVASHASELRHRLGAIVRAGDVLVAPWSRDGHTDHDACGTAAEVVAARAGCTLLEYPVWAWQWATPRDLESERWERFRPDASALRAKTRALDSFPSQTSDRFGDVIVDPAALARFRRPFEVYARVR